MKDNQILPTGAPAFASLPSTTNLAPRILVVDDDGDTRHVTAKVLKHSGYEVDTAGDGEDAWVTLQLNSYDLLITDHEMPKVTGVELVRKLRSARMALPVIMASGALPAEELNRNPELQLAATLAKPFTKEQLVGTVQAVLRATDSPRTEIAPPPDWQL